MRRTLISAMFLATLAFGPAAFPHEFWVEPATFRPEPGSVFQVGLLHGERFQGAPVPRDAERIERFVVVDDHGEQPVRGRSGGLVSLARIRQPGVVALAYRSRHATNRLDARAFEDYLAEEGLDRIIELRAQRGEQDEPGREVYSRCAKALIIAGAVESGADRLVGMPLEIIIEGNVAGIRAGEDVVARVLFQGRPLAGAALVAVHRDAPEVLHRVATGDDGRAVIAMPHPGVWMLTTLHMVSAPPETDADWESFWASTTFEAGAETVHGGTASPPSASPTCTLPNSPGA